MAGLGAWLWMGGYVDRAAHWGTEEAYRLSASAGFAVDDVLVEGRENTDPDVLLALINVQRGDPIFAFDPREASEMLERISWVRDAYVERRLPDTLYIYIEERVPLAFWQNKGKVRLIDRDGQTLANDKAEKFKDLILLVGEDAPVHAPDFLALLDAEPAVRGKVDSAVRIGARRWDLLLKNGIRVNLPENDPGFALRRLARADKEDGLLAKDLTVIDMREEDRITVRTRPGAVQEYKASYKVSGTGGNDI